MFHYNNRIGQNDSITKRGQNDSITKRGQNWIGDHKNRFNQDDIIMKRGENGILDYFSLEGHNTLFIVYTSASIIMILPP